MKGLKGHTQKREESGKTALTLIHHMHSFNLTAITEVKGLNPIEASEFFSGLSLL